MANIRGAMPRVLFSAWWLFGSAVLAGVALRPWAGDQLHVTRYTGYVMPWLLLGLVPGAAWGWGTRRWGLAVLLSASAVTIVIVHAPLFRPRPPLATPGAPVLKVMSYNTWGSNTDASRVAAVVVRHRPDVLLLQEIRPEVFTRFAEAVTGIYAGSPAHLVYDRELHQAIVSRYPLEPSASLAHKGNAQKATLRAPGGPITILNVHPLRSGGWRRRYTQIAALLEEDVLPESGPVILGGDFNAPDRSQLYDMVSSVLANAHDERGFGFGFTYPALVRSPLGPVPAVPLMRIDHLFFTDHFLAARAGTLEDSGGSDHRPVFADLVLRGATRKAGASAADARESPARQRSQLGPDRVQRLARED